MPEETEQPSEEQEEMTVEEAREMDAKFEKAVREWDDIIEADLEDRYM